MLHKHLLIILFFVVAFFTSIAQNFNVSQPNIIDSKNLWLKKKNIATKKKEVGAKQSMNIFYAKPDSISRDVTFGVYWRIHNQFLPEEYVYIREEEIVRDSINLKYKNGIVNFLWLNDSFNEDSITYTYSSIAPIKLDTIFFTYAHVNRSRMPNYIRTRVVNVNLNTGFPILNDAPVWENVITTDTSLTAPNNDPSYLFNDVMILPIEEEISFDLPFAVVVDFYGGDKVNDEFYLLCTYNNTCLDYYTNTIAQHSKFYPNSFFNISSVFRNQIIEGLFPSRNSVLGTYVNGNEIAGESEFCEAFYIQNWHIGASVSFEADFTGNIVTNADTLCVGDVLTLNAVASFGTPPYSYLWQNNDGSPISTQKQIELLAQVNKTYALRITDALDNSILIEKDIIVNRLRLTMPEDLSLACNTTTEIEPVINATSDNITYNWINGITEPTITAFPGNYSLTVTDGYCKITELINISIEADITADFETPLSNAFSVNFNNLSTNATSYFWDFGDGNTSSEANPSHTYLIKGTYVVSLIAQNADCSITKYKTINIGDFPVSINNGEFGNNIISITPNPSITGQFLVTLNTNQKNATVVSYTIFDLSGKTLLSKEVITNQQTQLRINLVDLPTGTYFLQIYDGHSIITKKLLLM